MSEYGEKRQQIITFHSAFKVRPADVERWRLYAEVSPEYGERWSAKYVMDVWTNEAKSLDTNDMKLIEEFLHERDKRVLEWTMGGNA